MPRPSHVKVRRSKNSSGRKHLVGDCSKSVRWFVSHRDFLVSSVSKDLSSGPGSWLEDVLWPHVALAHIGRSVKMDLIQDLLVLADRRVERRQNRLTSTK